MKNDCPGPPICTHTCAHRHCVECGAFLPGTTSLQSIAEFVENFGRLPTEWEKQFSDCYGRILALDRRSALN